MKIVNVHAAKTNLSELIVQVLAGEEVVIARSGTPVAKLVPFDVPEPARKFGALAGRLKIGPAFFEPLAAEELNGWSH
ncbi:MAG: type II toxin-antitoxin system Phd/YefM family antitoxin [Gemmatimonadales bacterium]|jgi:prevent-host-death family protein